MGESQGENPIGKALVLLRESTKTKALISWFSALILILDVSGINLIS